MSVCVCLPEARTRDVMKEFSGVYEQQYAVALFNSVRYEIEGGGGPQSQMLHRKASASISSNRGLQTRSGSWDKLCKTNVQTNAGLTLLYWPVFSTYLHFPSKKQEYCLKKPKAKSVSIYYFCYSSKCPFILLLIAVGATIYLLNEVLFHLQIKLVEHFI